MSDTQNFLFHLRQANRARDKEWDPEHRINEGFRWKELIGELGELANVLKKIEREQLGLRGTRATKEDLEEELADVFICLDLLAMQLGVTWEAIVPRKFNATSEKYGLATRLEQAVQ